ncbi:MAG TPA: response regulator [Pirellulales bacterium]|nr:response regulator [Pirellulales bacterium]
MDQPTATVFIVDDDREISAVLREIVESAGFSSVLCPNAECFLQACRSETPGCMILDVQLPGMSGLELQRTLGANPVCMPVIVLTGHSSVKLAVEVMQAGAFSFLEKPASPPQLLQLVQEAVELDAAKKRQATEHREAAQRVADLSEREREVMKLLVEATAPKTIAKQLGISTKTVDFHRNNLLAKMKCDSVSELIRFSIQNELAH